MKVLSAEQIRQWDEYTIANEPIASIDLMERAAEECTGWIIGHFAGATPVRVFCGKGNNGGDGLAIARQLSAKDFKVDVYILEFGSLGTDDFQANLKKLHSYPVTIHFIQHADFFPKIDSNDLLIDAMYGTGINRPLEGLSAQLVRHLNASKAGIISIDIPAGLYSDKSSIGNVVITATHTLTFQFFKLCFFIPENEYCFGEVTVLDIGLHADFLQTITSTYEFVDMPLVKQVYKPRRKFSHKGTFGHALVIAGERGKAGAAVLCTKACLRAGAGLVTVMVPEQEFSILQTAIPEAMTLSHQQLENLDLLKYNTIGIGPGIGTGTEGATLLQHIVWHYNKPVVLDADALNILSSNGETLKEIPPGSIMSPHPKEFERLFGKSNSHFRKIQVARQQAKKLFVYIILKGHYSVLACPDGQVYFNSTGNPGMATAGSGDVLTGILTGLLAQGYSSKEACLLGMYLHGLAGDVAAESLSQEALIASDIVGKLGKAFLLISS